MPFFAENHGPSFKEGHKSLRMMVMKYKTIFMPIEALAINFTSIHIIDQLAIIQVK